MEHDDPMPQVAKNLAALLAVLCGACSSLEPRRDLPPDARPLQGTDWRKILSDRLSSFGHRNLIAVVDSAYPEYSSPGVETVATGSPELEVLAAVLDLIQASGQVRAHAFLDLELDQVPEADAKGIGAHRDELKKLLSGVPVARQAPMRLLNGWRAFRAVGWSASAVCAAPKSKRLATNTLRIAVIPQPPSL
jgi:hypothetical protein